MDIKKTDSSNGFVIFQWPNKYLWVMFAAYLVGLYLTGFAYFFVRIVFYSMGILWSYEEIVHGANWFRMTLGTIVMIILIFNFLRLLLKI